MKIWRTFTKIFFLSFIFGILSQPVAADDFRQEWDPVPEAESYQYQISESPGFEDAKIARTAKVTEAKLSLSLRPGVYYFRLRAYEASGRAGRWTAPARVVVRATPPEFLLPRNGEKIEASTEHSPATFEWSSVEGAQDYEIVLSPAPLSAPLSAPLPALSRIVVLPTATFEGLPPGPWKARVYARVNGEPVTQSENISFEILRKALARPRILEPLDAQVLTAFEVSRVRWTRLVSGTRSEVLISRIDSAGSAGAKDSRAVLERRQVEDTTHLWIPRLAPGFYQITVKDYIDNTPQFVSQTVTVQVQADPLGYHSDYIGLTWRLFSLSPQFFSTTHDNWTLPASVAAAYGNPRINIESRLDGRIYHAWGFEASFALKYATLASGASGPMGGSSNSLNTSVSQQIARLGPTYRWEPLGVSKPVILKSLLTLANISNIAAGSGNSPASSSFAALGLRLGAELRWDIEQRSRYDFLGEATVDIPVLTDAGPLFGRSTAAPFPLVDLQAFVRRKLGDDWRLLLGGEAFIGTQNYNEPMDRKQTRMTDLSCGPKIAIEWDL